VNSSRQLLYLIIGFFTIVVVCVELHIEEIERKLNAQNGLDLSNPMNRYEYEKIQNRKTISNIEPIFKLQTDSNHSIVISGNLPKINECMELMVEVETLFFDKTIDNKILIDSGVNIEKWVSKLKDILKVLRDNGIDNLSILIEGEEIELDNSIDTIELKVETEKKIRNITNLFISNSIKIRDKVEVNIKIQRIIYELLKKNTIKFKKKSDTLTFEAKKLLYKIVESLRKIPNEKIRIEGHTNENKNAYKDKILSQKRANRVRDFFIKYGLNRDRMMSIGYGNKKIDNNTTTSKVEIYII